MLQIFLVTLCMLLLIYIYGGYLLFLKFLTLFIKIRANNADHEIELPSITVFFSAYNEEDKVFERIRNISECEYPDDKLEIMVVSDGSTDDTVNNVQLAIKQFHNFNIKLVEFKQNYGRAYAQNYVAKNAQGSILIATDAETIFTSDLLRNLVKPFSSPDIGVAGAIVVYTTQQEAEVAEHYAMYRNMEYAIRKYESRLGILVKTDGPCTAYRKNIWEEIQDFEDVDQVITLVARKKRFLATQVNDAICYDKANKTLLQDIRQRSRMTRKAILSTFHRWKFEDVIKYPLFSFALISHKLLRFLSPVLLLILLAGLMLSTQGRYIAATGFVLLFLPYLLGALKISVFKKLSSMQTSFLVAQIGFMLGIIDWLKGDKSGSYQPTRKF